MARSKEFEINEVLDKAIQLFWAQGYEKTSMQDLVNFMGIHRKSIYDTFGDKHDLFMKSLTRYEEGQKRSINSIIAEELPVKETIRKIVEFTTFSNQEAPPGCFLVNSGIELVLLDPEVAAFVKESHLATEELFANLIRKGQHSGEVKAMIDAQTLSHYILNAWLGLRTMVKTTNDYQKLKNILDVTLSVLD
ncbi:TetR/AcrR family transcriptional regulator [Paenibacillus massiliensis]|uniref:TetR/AcrR family transcriptional regulator n=1 Tax=Paenibacillus massiliensis TaxID=225917 RepID=UPI00036CEEA7|nr:TetR/AcrR family transcriptional regulator [Paenibacillus massiliensis]